MRAKNLPDPIMTAIDTYRQGCAAYNRRPDSATPHEDAIAISETYGPANEILSRWKEPAATRHGALAALILAREETEIFGCSPLALQMLNAAIGFYEQADQQPTLLRVVTNEPGEEQVAKR